MSEGVNIEKIFGCKVFTRSTMRERLTKSVYNEVTKIMDQGGELTPAMADVVAKAMKDWAVRTGRPIIPTGSSPLPVSRRRNMIPL